MEPVDGVGVQGGTVPAEIWHDFMTKALEDVEATPFPEPSQELLGDIRRDARLDVMPSTVDPGAQVTVEGVGFELCVNGWSVVIEGPSDGDGGEDDAGDDDGEPFRIESQSEGDTDESRRRATLDVPQDAASGEYRVSARCDFGTGPQPMGPDATLRVGSDEPTTTTSTTSTSSTTSSTSSSSTTTTTTTTSSTTTSSTTTSTTSAPDDG